MGKKLDGTLRSINWGATLFRDLAVYAPFDLIACPIRDRVIPTSTKRDHPIIACRAYYNHSKTPTCSPGERYNHKWIIKCLCWHYMT